MSKQSKPSDYTHSVWSGKKYDKPQTMESLVEEGLRVINAHSAIRQNTAKRSDWIEQYIRKHSRID
jgi:hypothetical protein